MVSEVTAYRAEDGSLHGDKFSAARHDAIAALSKLDIFNHASAQAIVQHAGTIVPLLQQVLDARPKVAVKPDDIIIEG